MSLDPAYARRLNHEYFEWMFDMVCGDRFAKEVSYRKLLTYLHETEFVSLFPRDENRAEEGMALRFRFAILYGYEDDLHYLDNPCSMLEMILALAIHCEDIVEDVSYGDRTSQWFWNMITSLGLGAMYDARFDEQYTEEIVARFLNREYEPNGKGGLFTIKKFDRDMREMEIWHQLVAYINGIM